MQSFAVLVALLASANAQGYWCGNTCPKDVSTMDDCAAAIASVVSGTQQNTDGHNDGEVNSVWKSGTCRIDFIPSVGGVGHPKHVANTVPQEWAQKLIGHCGNASDGGSAVGGVTWGKDANNDPLAGGCVCVHSTKSEDVCDCGGGTPKFGDCSQGYEIGT